MDKKGSLLNSQDADLRRRPTKKQTRQRPMIFHTPAGSSNVNNEFMKPRRKEHAASTTPQLRSAKRSTPASSTRKSPRFETPQSMVMAGTPQSGISSMQPSAKRSASSAKASSSSRKRAQPSVRRAPARKTPRQGTPSSGRRQSTAAGQQQQQRRSRATSSAAKGRQTKRGGQQTASVAGTGTGRGRGGKKGKAAAPATASRKSQPKPKAASKRGKKRTAPRTSTHLDPDYSPENAMRLYSLDAEARRSVTSITDLDTAVAAVDDCFIEAENSVDSNVVKMALREIAEEFRYHVLDMVELIQELKTVQRSLRRANTQSNKLRQALLEVQTERSALSAAIDQMRKDHEKKDTLRKATEEAHDYMTRCERMHTRALRRSKQEEEKGAAATQLHNTTANLITVRALLHSAPALASGADRLSEFLQSL